MVDVSETDWRARLARAVGPLAAVRALGGSAWMVEAGGRSVVAKVGPGALDEAEGLRELGAVEGGPPVPTVLHVDADLVVTTMVEQVARTPQHEASLGRDLARLHKGRCPHWGGGSTWIGKCPIDPSSHADGASFYGARLSDLAARCGLEGPVGRVVARLPQLVPPGGPSLLHGDLWWGNVLFGADGRCWLIDPSVHGGHPEEDLAMLALFGAVPPRVLAAYEEVHPLADGWRERVAFFQLYPLLVHTVVFGGGYRTQALGVAQRFA
jgi:fructosamine-3-kinase